MNISNKGIELIKQNEGCELEAYKCPVGVWTIGYGHTKGVKEGDEITPDQAESLLKSDLRKYEYAVIKQELPINQNQFDALVSFCYNVGPGNFYKSTLLKKAKIDVNDPEIKDEFMKWTKGRVKGVLTELPGLVVRRNQESDLYFSK